MTITLQTNLSSLQIANKLNDTDRLLGTSVRRLSTGLRITRPGDDPAGNQIADALKADGQLASVAIQNANTALSLTSIADSALSGTSALLTRMAELAEQSANGVYGNSQRSALSNEFVAIGSEIQRIAKITNFNGLPLLSAGQNVTVQVGIEGGQNSRVDLSAIAGTLDALGLAGTGSDALSFSIISTSDVGSVSASRFALDAVRSAIGSLNSQRGSLGALESRLNAAIGNLQGRREEFKAAESRIRDADIAQEVAELTRLQILKQAQAAVLAQANQEPGLALSLIRG